MLLLALSDAYIPDRAIGLPSEFKKLLNVPNKIGQVVLLGNCTRSYQFLKFVNDITSDVTIVRGEFDNATIATAQNLKEEIPMSTIIKQGEFKIGCCNGYTLVPKSDPLSLLVLARQLDVDIMLWGGTHSVEAYTLEGKFFINPGSCTGAYSSDWPLQDDVLEGVFNPEGQENGTLSQEQASPEAPSSSISNKQNASDEPKLSENSNSNGTNVGEKNEDNPKTEDFENSEDDEDIDEVDINGGCIPSFCLLDISASICTLYIYTFVCGEVKVDKVVYKKE
ncbi:retromer subunit VPS29 Ecym_4531 [Eremothecium cymbalariae DBVPG|uniref:Vacuolar protein sorting-associated protein 29 n=1 Tax=Eremothecium cymbalariae (strain CBS 270.75 / DBVPG 7215 / KCTC 17166 / NRRL Y-17582) TaxID=931890 RepID=G8JU65_ERECY|nr:hypothetical protein Ecym_4531 [Eremothecium cymbalariae DBVPG\